MNGGTHAPEFWQIVSGRVGLVGSAIRSVVLEEPWEYRGRRGTDRPNEETSECWMKVDGTLAERHPVMRQLLGALRRQMGDRVEATLSAFRKLAQSEGGEEDVLLALLTLITLLADDVSEHSRDADGQPLSFRTRWAATTLGLAVTDVLVAHAFEILGRLPTSRCPILGHLVRSVFERALDDGGGCGAAVAALVAASNSGRPSDEPGARGAAVAAR